MPNDSPYSDMISQLGLEGQLSDGLTSLLSLFLGLPADQQSAMLMIFCAGWQRTLESETLQPFSRWSEALEGAVTIFTDCASFAESILEQSAISGNEDMDIVE